MNREIKFRAKIKLNQDGYKFYEKEEIEFIESKAHDVLGISLKDRWLIINDMEDKSVISIFQSFCGVYELLQFSGLTDTNGIEIYEGDILQYDSENGIVTSKVVFNKSDKEDMTLTCFEMELINVEDYENDEAVEFTVIGNIHDNPELLK